MTEDAADYYAATRAFYQSCGFVLLRELELRSWNDAYALMLARVVGGGLTPRSLQRLIGRHLIHNDRTR